MTALLQQALDALTESVDLVANAHADAVELYSGYPSRQAKIAGLKGDLDAHQAAIAAIAAELTRAQPALEKYQEISFWQKDFDKIEGGKHLKKVTQPVQPAPVPSQYGSPELQSLILANLTEQGDAKDASHHGLDNDRQVLFYEQDFYVLSNFSSFAVKWRGSDFPTSEHAYHWEKFARTIPQIAARIQGAPSAHEAFKIAERERQFRRDDWDEVKVGVMREILFAKAEQHEYVRRKLLATGDRELIENSWRDDYWGWGPNCDGKNMLGKLWMEVRAAILAKPGEPT